MNTLDSVRAAAMRYQDHGWSPIGYATRTKSPTDKGWNKKTKVDVASEFIGNRTNIGVLLGAPSSNLVDVDLDCPEARRLAHRFLPVTHARFGRPSNPDSHWLYVAETKATRQWSRGQGGDGGKAMVVELRSTGGQTMFPPSIHPCGEQVAWTEEGDPADVDGEELTRACAKLAFASIVLAAWTPGHRNALAVMVIGTLIGHGWSAEHTQQFVQAISVEAGDGPRDTKTIAGIVENTVKRMAEGRACAGLPKLAPHLGVEADLLREWIDRRPPVEPSTVIDEMNKEYALTWAGGDAIIMREHYDPIAGRDVVTFVKEKALRLMLGNRFVTIGRKQVPLVSYWIASDRARRYNAVVFEPRRPGIPDPTNRRYYNLFRGWGVEPNNRGEAGCELFLRHTLEVICGGDTEHYDWLMCWLAQAVQEPRRRPGTAVVLRGGQGIGKGIWALYLGKLFGLHFVHLQDKDRLLGRFNLILRDAMLVYADELNFDGDSTAIGVLNAIITEPTVMIEPKFKDLLKVENNMRLVMATNEEWSVPTDHDARRFFMPSVSEHRKGDTPYFDDIEREMSGDGPACLMHYLLHYDIEGVDLRTVPKTRELAQQKELSLDPAHAFWLDALQNRYLVDDDYIVEGGNGVTDNGSPTSWEEGEIRVSKRAVHQAYLDYAHRTNARWQRASPQRLWNVLDTMCRGSDGRRLIRRPKDKKPFPVPDQQRL